ncbi:MAG: hypothetical protein ACKV0T_31860 [Planctomycetales bacterium]
MSSPVDSDLSYRVAVFATPDDVADLSEVLSEVLGLHATDAMIHARAAPGILPDRLSREQSERLAQAISDSGLQAAAIPVGEIPTFDHVPMVHHARCAPAGLEILELHGRPQGAIPWSDVELVSVGQVPREGTRHFAPQEMQTVRAARRTGPSTLETPLSPGPQALIIAAGPFPVLRIDHKQMNYEYLGERKTDSATGNFRMFLDDVVSCAPAAYLTPATRAYLRHGSVADYSFESADELVRSTVLHLLLHRREAGSNPAAPIDAGPDSGGPAT